MKRTFAIPRGAQIALVAAVLFGISTPLTKPFLKETSSFFTAGLLYFSSGISIYIFRKLTGAQSIKMNHSERTYFGLAVACGGIVAPVFLLTGLSLISASDASILLNLESVLTALIAWFIFKENFDKKILVGMLSIFFGACIISWNGNFEFNQAIGTILILLASTFWALDNNFTRNVISIDPTWIASTKGLIAGSTNLAVALLLGDQIPPLKTLAAVSVIGVFSFGLSLILFIVAMRQVGTSRAGAYFAIAPFFGAIVAFILGDPVTLQFGIAAIFMGFGIYLHISEDHHHEHYHFEALHCHSHFPDISHRHH